MPRDKSTITSGQWENLGNIIGDRLWDQEWIHELLQEHFRDCGVDSIKRIDILRDETFRRLEVGFQREKKS